MEGTLPLAWTAVAGAARYRVQVTPRENDFGVLALDTVVTNTELEARGSALSEALTPQPGGWAWRVRAEHDWGVGGWSEAAPFTIDEATPRRYYVTDHLGSTRAVVDPSQPEGDQVVETRDYMPFGMRMAGRHVNRDPTETDEDFTGHEFDAGTQLHYAGARYYMSALGRWTARDPRADKYPAHSPYNYVVNSPMNAIDPDGRDFIMTVDRNDEGEITGLSFSATVYTQDQASYRVAQRAAQQWNRQDSEKINSRGFFSRLVTGADVDVSVKVDVKKVENARDAANDDPGGNSFKLHQGESDFESKYQEMGGEHDPSRVGGVVAGGKYGYVPSLRNGQNANLDTRVAHEFGHFFGLDDNAGDGDLMNYEQSNNVVEGYNQMAPAGQDVIGQVGKEWRGTARNTQSRKVGVDVSKKTVTVIE